METAVKVPKNPRKLRVVVENTERLQCLGCSEVHPYLSKNCVIATFKVGHPVTNLGQPIPIEYLGIPYPPDEEEGIT